MQFLSEYSFLVPENLVPSAWNEHAPFAFWLVDSLRPKTVVELGAHNGFSYFCFCQAAYKLALNVNTYAIDTWKGDEHAGFYGEDVFAAVNMYNQRFASFSNLIRSTFDDALSRFENGSIDILHIDGRHYYEDVSHDFLSWLPKMSERGIVLFHDTNVHDRGFGVRKLWAEVREQYPSFEFLHGHGLGILGVGSNQCDIMTTFFTACKQNNLAHETREIYSRLGEGVALRIVAKDAQSELSKEVEQLTNEKAIFESILSSERQRFSAEIRLKIAQLGAAKVVSKQSESSLRDRVAEGKVELNYALAELKDARARPLANVLRYWRWRVNKLLAEVPLLSSPMRDRMNRRQLKNAPDYSRYRAKLHEHVRAAGHFGEITPPEKLKRLKAKATLASRLLTREAPADLAKPIAIITTFNDCDVIPSIVEKNHAGGVEQIYIDNWSTDGTWELLSTLKEKYESVLRIERYPNNDLGYLDWHGLLGRKEQIAMDYKGRWILHQDSDEISISPFPHFSLARVLHEIEGMGFNCVPLRILDFRPIKDGFFQEPLDEFFEYFEFSKEATYGVQDKIWLQADERVDLKESGGHSVAFAGKSVFPIRLPRKHYSIRSLAQGARKLTKSHIDRLNHEREKLGWHTHLDSIDGTHILYYADELLKFDHDKVLTEWCEEFDR